MDIGIVPIELLQSERVVVAVNVFLSFEVVNKGVVDAFGDDIIFEVEEIFGNKTQVIGAELFELGPRHIAQIEAIKVVVGAGIIQVVAIDTIVEYVDEMAETESGSFDGFWDIAMGADEVPFMGFGVEGFEVVVGDEHAIATERHHFAIVLEEVAIEVAAMVNRFIEADGGISFEFEDVSEAVDIEEGIFSDGEKGGFAIFKYAQIGFFVEVLEDGISDGFGLVGCEFLGDAGCGSKGQYQCSNGGFDDIGQAM